MSLTVVAPAVASPALAPHRAVYELSLASASERSGIASVSGRMVLEFAGSACSGYTVNSRIVTRFGNAEGQVNLTDIRSTSWESADGKSFRFSNRQYLNQSLSEETEGRAERGDGNNDGVGILTKPAEETFPLPPRAVFPAEHNLRIMQAALDGKTIDTSIVFDGTDGKKIFTASTIIGKVRAASATDLPDVEGAEVLRPLRAWPVTMSFFDDSEPSGGEQTPSHEISFVLFENGVSTDLVLDYGDFVVNGTVSGLEMLDQERCP